MRVRIEQEHIDAGKPCDCSECAAALAIAAEFGPPAVVEVYEDHVEVHDIDDRDTGIDHELHCYRLPKEAQEWINAFDRGAAMHPFEFDMELVV